MGVSGLMLATTALQSITQINQGYLQKQEYGYNAQILDAQASDVQMQMDIDNAQFQRLKNRTWSTSMANVAKAGLMPVGSALAVMADTQTQIGLDQAVSKYNLQKEKDRFTSEAQMERVKGKFAVRNAWSSALMNTGKGFFNYAMYNGAGSGTTNGGGTKSGLDYSTKSSWSDFSMRNKPSLINNAWEATRAR